MFKTSESIKEISEALAKAQGIFPDIPKDKEVTVKMKSGGTYAYKYAELSSIVKATRKPLSENGLSFIQGVEKVDGDVLCITKLIHSSGQWYETSYPVIYSEEDMQGFAGGFTFSRRYGLSALLGVATEEDTDGNGANRDKDKNKFQQQKEKPPASQSPPPQEKQTAKPPAEKKIFEVPNQPLTAIQKMELGKFVIPGGPYKGKKLGEIPFDDLMLYKVSVKAEAEQAKQPLSLGVQDLLNRIDAYYLDFKPN